MYGLFRVFGLFNWENDLVTFKFKFQTLVIYSSPLLSCMAVGVSPAVAANQRNLNILEERKKCLGDIYFGDRHLLLQSYLSQISLKMKPGTGQRSLFILYKITQLSTPSPIYGAATYKQFNIALSVKNQTGQAPLIADPPSASSTLL